MSQTSEKAFESCVETLLAASGWEPAAVSGWEVERAFFPTAVLDFIETTQPKVWAEFEALHGALSSKLLLNCLAKELDVKGMLHVLRVGFKCHGRQTTAHDPCSGLNTSQSA